MGNSFRILFTLALLIKGVTSYAAETDFNINNSKFSLEFGSEWRATEGLFGLPLVLSGPIEKKSRPIISVTPTPFDRTEFNDEALKGDQKVYERERKKWLRSKKGQALSFDKMTKLSFKNSTGYRVGYTYKINDRTFSEASYYLICDKKLYHLKYLMKDEQIKRLNDIQKIVRSFECR